MSASTWHVYLLRCADNTLYCGIALNVQRRLAQHNGFLPGGARYTRGRRPVRLLGSLDCEDRSAALKLEIAVKRMKTPQKVAFFAMDGK